MKNPNQARTTNLKQPRIGGKFVKRSDAVVQRDDIVARALREQMYRMRADPNPQPTMSDPLIRPDGLQWTNCDGDAMAIEAANRVVAEDTAAVVRTDDLRITWEDIAWFLVCIVLGVGSVVAMWANS